jgi:hypothetical protein
VGSALRLGALISPQRRRDEAFIMSSRNVTALQYGSNCASVIDKFTFRSSVVEQTSDLSKETEL